MRQLKSKKLSVLFLFLLLILSGLGIFLALKKPVNIVPKATSSPGVSAKKGVAGSSPFKNALNRAHDLNVSWYYSWSSTPFWGNDSVNWSPDAWNNPEFIPTFLSRGPNCGCQTDAKKTARTASVNTRMNPICSNGYCQQNRYYLIGNEPEIVGQDLCPGTTDAVGDAIRCYGTIIRAIRIKDATARFIILGLSWENPSFVRDFIIKWRVTWQGTEIENLSQTIRGWHLHSYGNYWECPDDSRPRVYQETINNQMQITFSALVPNQEIWVTEMGSLNNLPAATNQTERQRFLRRLECLVNAYENSPIVNRYAWFYAGEQGNGWVRTNLFLYQNGGYIITDLGIKYATLPASSQPTPTQTPSHTPTPSVTLTPSPTATPTTTATPTPTATGTPQPTPTVTPQPTPTTEPSPTPPPDSCPLFAKGDADCNEVINVADYALWRKEFIDFIAGKSAPKTGWKSDFDRNGVINVADYAVWRKYFTESLN